MQDISVEIARLLQFGMQRGLLEKADCTYAANRMLAVLGLDGWDDAVRPPVEALESPAPILEAVLDWAYETGRLEGNTASYRDVLDTELMDCMMPRPSEVIQRFYMLYEEDPCSATAYYYQLSRSSHYIRTDRVARDERWTVPTAYGELVITINLSKPEKDPQAIAAARNLPQAGYPKCALCRENEGLKGNLSQAPRANHRLIPLKLLGEEWFLQYSPYVYYNEHCIVLNKEHTPMKVDRDSMARLVDFVRQFPHYFIGSNADLPIVGGSILSHDHFQGGRYEFPMAKAPIREEITFWGFEDVSAGIVRWPMSVLRLRSEDKERLLDLAEIILKQWRDYTDASVGIYAHTDAPHNTITPICRMREGVFELDLVFRNNRTTPEHPLGLFHPHQEYHHIKKENIGLIEVMGLAILPARLKKELALVEEALAHPEREGEIFSQKAMEPHYEWYCQLKEKAPVPGQVHGLVQQEVGRVFCEILGNAGVFKDTEEGREAFGRFCQQVNRSL